MKYELANKAKGNKIIATLESRLKHFQESSKDKEYLSIFKDIVNIIKECQLNESVTYLNKILKQYRITRSQAICITLGLNPQSAELLEKHTDDIGISLLEDFLSTKESNMLSMITSTEGLIDVKNMINKLLDQEIVKSVNGQTETSNKPKIRQSTIEKRVLINKCAREVIKNYPDSTIESVALDLAEMDGIKPMKVGTLMRNYLEKHPNY